MGEVLSEGDIPVSGRAAAQSYLQRSKQLLISNTLKNSLCPDPSNIFFSDGTLSLSLSLISPGLSGVTVSP